MNFIVSSVASFATASAFFPFFPKELPPKTHPVSVSAQMLPIYKQKKSLRQKKRELMILHKAASIKCCRFWSFKDDLKIPFNFQILFRVIH
jgi:hypothetical protein